MKKYGRIVQGILSLLICHGVILTIGGTAYLICAAVVFSGILLTMTQIGWGWWLSRDVVISAIISSFWPILIIALIIRWSAGVAAPEASNVPLATVEPGLRRVENTEERQCGNQTGRQTGS